MPIPEDDSDFDDIIHPTYVPPDDETFQQRRRRVDQQETVWIRNRQPLTEPQRPIHEQPSRESHGRQKRARQDSGPDLELNVDCCLHHFQLDGTMTVPGVLSGRNPGLLELRMGSWCETM